MNTMQWIQSAAAAVSIIGVAGVVSAQQASPDSGPTRVAPTQQTQGGAPMRPMPADRMLPAPRAPGASMSTVPGNDRTLDANRQDALERDRAATDIRARDGDRSGVAGERAARADRN